MLGREAEERREGSAGRAGEHVPLQRQPTCLAGESGSLRSNTLYGMGLWLQCRSNFARRRWRRTRQLLPMWTELPGVLGGKDYSARCADHWIVSRAVGLSLRLECGRYRTVLQVDLRREREGGVSLVGETSDRVGTAGGSPSVWFRCVNERRSGVYWASSGLRRILDVGACYAASLCSITRKNASQPRRATGSLGDAYFIPR